jgi:hypothetical protein
MRRTPALAFLGAAAGLAVSARGQPEAQSGPVIVGERKSFTGVQLDRLNAAINYFGQWRLDKVETDGQPTQESTEQLHRGDFELSGRAFVGHEDLLDLSGSVRLGLEHQNVESDVPGAEQDDNRNYYLYDLNGRFFSESMLPTTLFTSRQESLLDRAFASTIRSTNSEYGVLSRLNSDVFPLSVQYVHRDIDQDDPFGVADFSVRQDTLTALSDMQLTPNQHLTLEYRLDSVDEARSGTFVNNFDRHDLIGTHTLTFGDRDEHSLRSVGRFYDQTGTVDQSRYRLDEVLRLTHSEAFETQYDLTYERREFELESQDYIRAQALARHRLYESLVTTFSVGGTHIDTHDIGTSDQLDTEAIVNYVKRVPYGQLDASAGLGFVHQVESDRGQPVSVPDRAVVIPDAAPAIVPVANVVPGTVRVTDIAGIRVYLEGIDYDLQLFPDRFEIRRIVGGAIAPGETALVSFVVGPQPGATIDSLAGTISARYTVEDGLLAGLSPYFRYSQIDRWLDTEAPQFFFVDDVQVLVYGIEYRRGPIFLRGEQEHRDSEFTPFDATRLEAGYFQRLGVASSLTLNYTYEIIDRPLENDTLTLNRAIVRWYGRVLEELDVGVSLLYRDEDSRAFGDSTGFEQALELTWRRGRTTANLALRNSMLDTDTSQSTSQYVRFGLTRRF